MTHETQTADQPIDQPADQPAPRGRSTRTRLLTGLAAAALLLGAGGVGAAVGAGLAGRDEQTTATAAGTAALADPEVEDTTEVPSYERGPGAPGALRGPGSVPAPGGYSQGDGGGTATAVDATAEQSVGMVLVDTVLSDGEAAGTGMVISEDGAVLTNYHVVEGATEVTVTVATTGETYAAEVVGRDAAADVALLQLQDAQGLTTVALDDDEDPLVGDTLTAVGNAQGQGYLSASTGEVTALDQDISTGSTSSAQGEELVGLIELDAAVVGGYSGGAVLDEEGEVVGVTTAASTGPVAESYAVPIEDALAVVALIESGQEGDGVVVGPTAYLGVAVDTRSGRGAGALVAAVEEGSAAERAGLVAGDTVVALGGTAVTDHADLAAAVASHEPGEEVLLTWTDAAGQEQQAAVALGEAPTA